MIRYVYVDANLEVLTRRDLAMTSHPVLRVVWSRDGRRRAAARRLAGGSRAPRR